MELQRGCYYIGDDKSIFFANSEYEIIGDKNIEAVEEYINKNGGVIVTGQDEIGMVEFMLIKGLKVRKRAKWR